MAKQPACMVKAVLLDFGGVLSEEGFRDGLAAIARLNGIAEESLIALGHDLVHETGYVLGKAGEQAYWQAIRERAGIHSSDEALRREILSRFKLRPWMIEIVRRLREAGVTVAVLSDQTNWLDELDRRDDFFRFFDRVFNSYHLGKSKRDPEQFDDVLAVLGVPAGQALFVDDDAGHCERALQRGLHVIHYTDRDVFLKELVRYCPFLSGISLP